MYSLGYLIGNYPDSWLLQRFPTGKVLATSEHHSSHMVYLSYLSPSIATLIWGTIVITCVLARMRYHS